METKKFFVGLDLGQTTDPTALAVLERAVPIPAAPAKDRRPPYTLRYLDHFPLGTSYPEIVKKVVELLQTAPLLGTNPLLAVDETGVGRPVVDMFRDAGRVAKIVGEFGPITITAGREVGVGPNGGARVPKRFLIGRLVLLMQTQRLHADKSMRFADVLIKELEKFSSKITLAGNEVLEAWREGDHDDLVLAVALAAWHGEQRLPPLVAAGMPPPTRLPGRITAR